MNTYNIVDLIPRLERLRKVTRDSVNISFELWLHQTGQTVHKPEVKWDVWSGKTHYYSDTPDGALRQAELASNILTGEVPATVVVP